MELRGPAEPLRWRGVLALHFILIDCWLLTGRGTSYLGPTVLRKHWAAEPIWVLASFVGISLGLHELASVAATWLGPRLRPDEFDRGHDSNIAIAFASLTIFHLLGLPSAALGSSTVHVRLVSLGLVIALLTALTHRWLSTDETIVLDSVYGRPFEPLRYLLWAHSSPSLAIILSAGKDAEVPETAQLPLVRMVVGCLVTGFLCTARAPPLLLDVSPAAQLAFSWGWRLSRI